MLTTDHQIANLLKQAWLGSVLVLLTALSSAQEPAKQPEDKTTQSVEVLKPPLAEPADGLCVFPPIKNKITPTGKPPTNRTHLQADEADMKEKALTRFSGNVLIERDGQRIEADKARYSHTDENFDAEGNVRFLTEELEVYADTAKMNLKQNRGTLQQTRYRTMPENASGTAETVNVKGPNLLIMHDATYTTCPSDKVDWELNAGTITLDRESRQGSATNVVIDFMGIPFLYLPYLGFPLGDERLSGFLFPSFSISDNHGTEISVPYYWNIAPEMDATLTAHNMTRRGVMLENEIRYLNQESEGQLEIDHIEDDKVYGDSRSLFKWHHQSQATEGWSTVLDYQQVSDNQYLADFGGNIRAASATHLEQRATLSYNAELWQFNALAQDFQTLSGDQPYRRLPQLTLASRLAEQDNRLNFNASTEWVHFDHADKSKYTADRSHFQPVVSLPFRNQAAFFIPKVTGYYTQYELSEIAPHEDKSPSRSIAVSSLDTGLFMERDTSVGNTPLLQTFEPRLFYVYAPYQDQSHLPIFDSGRTPFSFNSLFEENRFSGVDRVGDTNRLTVALTTRFLHQNSGAELFSASVGRIYYFDDRRVGLADITAETQPEPETENNTDYVGRLAMQPARHWYLTSDIQWDDDTHSTRYQTSRLTYRRNRGEMFTYGQRYRKNGLSTRDIGLVWSLAPHWQFLAGRQYDVRNERNIETVYGLKYNSCCWGLRIVAREYYNGVRNGQDYYQNSIYLVLELKGLSNFGSDQTAESVLKQTIIGY